MFERFTDRARRVLVLAQEEARLLAHGFIGTEHILLGIIGEGHGIGAKALAALDVALEPARRQVEEIVGQGAASAGDPPPFTPRAKKVLELSLREALQLGHSYIGTEHLLLGLVREGEGVATQVLVNLGVPPDRVRQQVMQGLSGVTGRAGSGFVDLPGGRGSLRRTLRSAPSLGASTSSCSFCGRDLWDAEHFVRRGTAAICSECVSRARRAIENVSGHELEVDLPPILSGRLPTDETVAAVVATVHLAFSADPVAGGDAEEAMDKVVEDFGSLRQAIETARRRFPGVALARLERIRFVSDDLAEIRVRPFDSTLQISGHLVRTEGNWRVSRETISSLLARAGLIPVASGPTGAEAEPPTEGTGETQTEEEGHPEHPES